MKNKNYIRTDVSKGNFIELVPDREVITGFAVVTSGITHDERGEFDIEDLENIVALGNDAKFGIKSRFGHPNMSGTALGTFLGRVKNFRLDGEIVRADLHIDPSAHKTPDGDLASYVLSLAKNDPDAFGTSMVIETEMSLRLNEKGERLLDDDGEPLPALFRTNSLLSVDVVDEPAANNSFFGKKFFSESVKPSAEMTEFLDEFLNEPDGIEQAISFLNRYKTNKNNSGEVVDLMKSRDKMDVQFEAPVNIDKHYIEKGVNEDPKSGQWIVEGFAATVDLDLQDEIISDEALANSENDLLENSTVLFNHDINTAVGKVLKTEKRERGLWVQILISKTVPDVWQQIQEGVLNKFSIRGRVIDVVRKFAKEANKTVRVIKEMLLVEVSLVPLPANPKAKTMGWFVAKALDDYETKGGELPMTEEEKMLQKDGDEAVAAGGSESEGEATTEAGEGEDTTAEEGGGEDAVEVEGEGEAVAEEGEGEAATEDAGEGEKQYTQSELDEAINKAVSQAISKKEQEFSRTSVKLSKEVKELQYRLDESEADSAVEKSWNDKYSFMYTEEDAPEIKKLLKKMQMKETLSTEEMNTLIDKKEVQETEKSSLPVSETITSKGISPERKEELLSLGGIKTNINQKA